MSRHGDPSGYDTDPLLAFPSEEPPSLPAAPVDGTRVAVAPPVINVAWRSVARRVLPLAIAFGAGVAVTMWARTPPAAAPSPAPQPRIAEPSAVKMSGFPPSHDRATLEPAQPPVDVTGIAASVGGELPTLPPPVTSRPTAPAPDRAPIAPPAAPVVLRVSPSPLPPAIVEDPPTARAIAADTVSFPLRDDDGIGAGRAPILLSPPATDPASAARDDAVPGDRAALPTPAVPATRAPLVVDEESSVRQTLRGYATAFRQMDVVAAARVWPSVDRSTLARTFDTLASQNVALGRCQIEIDLPGATARCTGHVEYVRKSGSTAPRVEAQQWVFRMEKRGEDWLIADVAASSSGASAPRR